MVSCAAVVEQSNRSKSIPSAKHAARPREINPSATHALEILGHAIEYLLDEYASHEFPAASISVNSKRFRSLSPSIESFTSNARKSPPFGIASKGSLPRESQSAASSQACAHFRPVQEPDAHPSPAICIHRDPLPNLLWILGLHSHSSTWAESAMLVSRLEATPKSIQHQTLSRCSLARLSVTSLSCF